MPALIGASAGPWLSANLTREGRKLDAYTPDARQGAVTDFILAHMPYYGPMVDWYCTGDETQPLAWAAGDVYLRARIDVYGSLPPKSP